MRFRCDEQGQGTVEAAFVLPVLMGLVLLLVQPGIISYDRMVMASAASEACRLLVTSTDDFGMAAESSEAFVRHRLSAVPAQDYFHDHSHGCSWEISLSGNEDSSEVSVEITNRMKPLPLVAFGMAAFKALDGNGDIAVSVRASANAQPEWVAKSVDADASSWAGRWLE